MNPLKLRNKMFILENMFNNKIEQHSVSEFPVKEVAICEYKDKKETCDKPATVFITTTWYKRKYCDYHFSVILFKGGK